MGVGAWRVGVGAWRVGVGAWRVGIIICCLLRCLLKGDS